jgi:hypothetical protein
MAMRWDGSPAPDPRSRFCSFDFASKRQNQSRIAAACAAFSSPTKITPVSPHRYCSIFFQDVANSPEAKALRRLEKFLRIANERDPSLLV